MGSPSQTGDNCEMNFSSQPNQLHSGSDECVLVSVCSQSVTRSSPDLNILTTIGWIAVNKSWPLEDEAYWLSL